MKLEAGNYTLHEVEIFVEKEAGGSFDGSMLFLTREEDASKTSDFIDGWVGTPKDLIRDLNKRGIDTIVIGWESTDIECDGKHEIEKDDEDGFEESDYMFHFVDYSESATEEDSDD